MSKIVLKSERTILACDVCQVQDVVGLYTCMRCQRETGLECLRLIVIASGTLESPALTQTSMSYHCCKDCIIIVFHALDDVVRGMVAVGALPLMPIKTDKGAHLRRAAQAFGAHIVDVPTP